MRVGATLRLGRSVTKRHQPTGIHERSRRVSSVYCRGATRTLRTTGSHWPVLRAWSSRNWMAASRRVSLLANRNGSKTEQAKNRRAMTFVELPEKGCEVVAGIGQMRIAIAEQGLTASLQHLIDGGKPFIDRTLVLIAYDHIPQRRDQGI